MRAHAAGSAGSPVDPDCLGGAGYGGVCRPPRRRTMPGHPRPLRLVIACRPRVFGERGFGNVTVSVARRGQGHRGCPKACRICVRRQATSIDLNNFAWRDMPSGRSLAGDCAAGQCCGPKSARQRNPAALSARHGETVRSALRGRQRAHRHRRQPVAERRRRTGVLTVRWAPWTPPDGPHGADGATVVLEAGGELLARGVPLIRIDSGSGRRVGDGARRRYGEHPGGRHAARERCALDVSGATGTIDGGARRRPLGARACPGPRRSSGWTATAA